MTKQNAQEIAKALFPHYPNVNEFYISSDGQAFESATNAVNHARTLKDTNITTVSKADLPEEPTPAVVKPETIEHVVTAADLEENPDWEKDGIKVGDKIQIAKAN